MSGGPADHARKAGCVSAHQIQCLVQRTTTGVRLDVIVIIAAQFHDSKECVHLTGAGVINDFQRPCGLVIGHQRTVIEQILDDAPGIPKHRIAQAGFETLDDVGYPFLSERLVKGGDEGFRFPVCFLEALRLEFFLDSVSADTGMFDRAARRLRPSSMASCSSVAVSSSKRRPFSRCSRTWTTCPEGTRTVRFFPFSQH